MTRIARAHAYLVAPDSFKGTFSAAEVAKAIGRGLESRGARVDLCPVADGGEGTGGVLLEALGGQPLTSPAHDPLGREIEAGWARLEDGRAVVEVASASGLGLVDEGKRDAERASSFGTGELIVAAVEAGAREVLVAAGGSATTDGGAGAVRAIEESGGLGGARLAVLCDVRTCFEDAARVFAPQKGAGAEAVERLTARLDEMAQGLPRDPRGVEMTGAAGGLAGGLWAEFGAELRAGAAAVLEAVGFERRLADADACVSGEGRLDSQSLTGKLVGEVAERCSDASVPLHLLVGQVGLDEAALRDLGAASAEAATTLEEIEAAAARLT